MKKVAWIFRKNLEEVDGLSARFGGEEFVGAVIKLSEEKALEVASKICKDIAEEKIEHSSSPLGIVTVSIGVAIAKKITDEAEHDIRSKLMKIADECLYESKSTGKNKHTFKKVEIENKSKL